MSEISVDMIVNKVKKALLAMYPYSSIKAVYSDFLKTTRLTISLYYKNELLEYAYPIENYMVNNLNKDTVEKYTNQIILGIYNAISTKIVRVMLHESEL